MAVVVLSRLAAISGFLVVCLPSAASAQVVTTYGYDVQGQVTNVARGGASVTYTYDQAANRTAVTSTGSLALRSAPVASAVRPAAAGPVSITLVQAQAMFAANPSTSTFAPDPKPPAPPPGPMPAPRPPPSSDATKSGP